MLDGVPIAPRTLPHVVTVGNEKGGSGKTTIAMHVAVGLLKAGYRVSTIDLDTRQRSLSHYVESRRRWSQYRGIGLELPKHYCLTCGDSGSVYENERKECAIFEEVISATELSSDFIVIDTPGANSYLMRLAHLMADTLLIPIHDSFLDLEVLAPIDPVTLQPVGISRYANMVAEVAYQRRCFDKAETDWVLLRNRYSLTRVVENKLLLDLGMRLGFRHVDGCTERVVYRHLYPRGLTALDESDERTLGFEPNRAFQSARQEVCDFMPLLKLGIDERSRMGAEFKAPPNSLSEADEIFTRL